MKPFTPSREGMVGTVQIDVHDCPLCARTMLLVESPARLPFPRWMENTLEKQMARVGWVHAVYSGISSRYVCSRCVEEGKEILACTLCKKEIPLKLVKESFGDPPEWLCMNCYETVPAKAWDDKCGELTEKHRFDYE